MDDFENELRELIQQMDKEQLGIFLTISVARDIVCLSEDFFTFDVAEEVNFLNPLFISVGINCILYFYPKTDLENTIDRAILVSKVRAKARDLAKKDFVMARAADRNLDIEWDLELSREIDISIARAVSVERPHIKDFTMTNYVNRARAAAASLGLESDDETRVIMLEDAKSILAGAKSFSHEELSLYSVYKERVQMFIQALRKFNSLYWADFFGKLLQNNFKLDETDIKTIFSIPESQFACSIEGFVPEGK